MKKRILLTGGAGFIGFHLAKKLLEQDFSLVIADNLNKYYDVSLKKARLKELKGNFEFIRADIANYQAMEEIFKKYKFDKICHLAAQVGVRHSFKNPSAYISSNILGLVNLLELSKKYGVKDFIFASSSSVYGNNKKIPFSENDRTDSPISLYAATKKSGEEIAYSYHHLFGINCIILRFFTVYGPWGRPDMAYFLFTKNIAEGNKIKVYNKGEMSRDFTYIDDAVEGIISALGKVYPYEVFNLGSNNPVQLEYLISCIEKELNKKAIKEYLPLQPGDALKTWADVKKAEKMLNFKSRVSIEEGIKRFVNWYRFYHKC